MPQIGKKGDKLEDKQQFIVCNLGIKKMIKLNEIIFVDCEYLKDLKKERGS